MSSPPHGHPLVALGANLSLPELVSAPRGDRPKVVVGGAGRLRVAPGAVMVPLPSPALPPLFPELADPLAQEAQPSRKHVKCLVAVIGRLQVGQPFVDAVEPFGQLVEVTVDAIRHFRHGHQSGEGRINGGHLSLERRHTLEISAGGFVDQGFQFLTSCHVQDRRSWSEENGGHLGRSKGPMDDLRRRWGPAAPPRGRDAGRAPRHSPRSSFECRRPAGRLTPLR